MSADLAPELRVLHDLARAEGRGFDDPNELLDGICTSVVENFGFDRASIWRYFPENEVVRPVASYGVPVDQLPESLPVEGQLLLRRALEAQEAVFVGDVAEDRVISDELVEAFGIRSILAVPLMSEGTCLGFLAADRGGRTFRLDRRTLDLHTTVGVLTGVFLRRALEREELMRLDRAKSDFIALASHELRTPASVIYGISATLDERGDVLPQEQLHALRQALREQSDRMYQLVEQLLDISRLEANAIEIRHERFSVRPRVEELAQLVAASRAADVRVDVAPDLEVMADPDAFDRIVSNLIANAVRYGGAPITVAAEQRDRHFRLAVEDRGRGVSPEFVPRLFERFARSEESGEARGGAGLGLSIAASYARAQGGDLFYEPAKPHGARFELVLPRTNATN